MPMPIDDHNAILEQLNNPELTHSERTEALQKLRADYNDFHQDFNKTNETNTKLQKDNDDLIVSNSQLFRQAGIVGNKDKIEENESKNYSETITVSAIEKGNN